MRSMSRMIGTGILAAMLAGPTAVAGAAAQAPAAIESASAEVNGTTLHYRRPARASPSCCCTAMPRTATCGGR